jgi:phosphate-selective porin OprO/OprP
MEEHCMFIRSEHRRRLWSLVASGALLAQPAATWAKEPSRAELEDRIRRLEQIIHDNGLDRPVPRGGRAAPAARPAAPAATAEQVDKPAVEAIVEEKLRKQKILAGWKDGFFLESPGGDFKLKIRGLLQTQFRDFPSEDGDTGTDSVFLRRVRPIVEGTVYKYFDFKIMPDFGQSQTRIFDAYFDVNYFKPWVALRGGKFKPPLSLERLQSAQDLLFAERSISNQLAPNRDTGFQFGGDVFNFATWQVGVFDGALDNQLLDSNPTSDFDADFRLFLNPFTDFDIDALKGFGVGFAGDYGHTKEGDNLNVIQYRTPGASTFFTYNTSTSSSNTITVLANGDHFRVIPQGYYYWGPFGFMGEYINSTVGAQRTQVKTSDKTKTTTVREAQFDNQGWFVQASYVLTGEDASYKGVVPINPFDPLNGRWGAFELAAQGSYLGVDPKAFSLGFAKRPNSTQHASTWAVGVNWYLNKNFKLQADWYHTDFDTPVMFGDHLRDHENVILTQFQIAY